MFKFLLVMFLISPNGVEGTAKIPVSSLQECQELGAEYSRMAYEEGYVIIGTCVEPKDYVASS